MLSPLFDETEWWAGVGNAELLQCGKPLLAIRLSRTLPKSRQENILSAALSLCENALPISTFISPMEILLLKRLTQQGFPVIRVVPDVLATIYKPTTEELPLFAERRLLLLSCVYTPPRREDAWHALNQRIARLAIASGGQEIYWRKESFAP